MQLRKFDNTRLVVYIIKSLGISKKHEPKQFSKQQKPKYTFLGTRLIHSYFFKMQRKHEKAFSIGAGGRKFELLRSIHKCGVSKKCTNHILYMRKFLAWMFNVYV